MPEGREAVAEEALQACLIPRAGRDLGAAEVLQRTRVADRSCHREARDQVVHVARVAEVVGVDVRGVRRAVARERHATTALWPHAHDHRPGVRGRRVVRGVLRRDDRSLDREREEVGAVQVGPRAPEARDLRTRRRRRPVLAVLPHASEHHVVAQVLADAGDVAHQRDVEAGEFIAVADARQHQQLRRVDRAHRDDDLGVGVHAQARAAVAEVHADRCLVFEADPLHQGASQHRQVGTIHHRMDVGPEDGATRATHHGLVDQRAAAGGFHERAVHVGKQRQAARLGRGQELPREGRWVACGLHGDCTFPAAIAAAVIARIGLDARLEQLEHGLVAPGGVVRGAGEMVPVRGVSARPGRHVDARAAAETFAHRVVECPAAEMWAWHASKRPVELGAERGGPQVGIVDERTVVAGACFEEQHLHLWIGGEPCSDDAAARACAADDVVVVPLDVRRQAGLVRANARVEGGSVAGGG